MDFEIIHATSDHLDQIAPLFDAYRVFYRQPSDPDRARAFIAERLENQDSIIFLALSTEPEPAALGFTQLYPLFSSVSMQSLWLLNDLYVAESARKTGVGGGLMLRARAHAESTGAKGLELATQKENRTAQSLYEAMGYVRDEAFYRYALTLEP